MDRNNSDCYIINKFKRKFLIEWNSKCGSTTILSMFLQNLGLRSGSDKTRNTYHWYRKNKLKKVNLYKENVSDDVIKLKFVRNPYTRIVSIYLHFVKGLNAKLSFYEFLEKFKVFIIEYPKTGLEGDKIDKLFKNGIKKHCSLLDLCYKQTTNKKYNHIIKIEELDDEIIKLNKKYKINIPIKIKIQNSKIKGNIKGFCGYKKFDNRIPQNYKLYYNDKIKNIVDEIYSDDIQNFNYNFNF